MTRAHEFVNQIEYLPAFPVVLTRLLQAMRDDRASASAVSEIVQTDPGLTSNVLRIANSPFFRGTQPTTKVFDAVTRLGTKRLSELAVGTWFHKSLPRTLPLYEQGAESFWMHSLATGVIANRLAIAVSLSDGAAAIAGLLHDIGKLVVVVALETHHDQLVSQIQRGGEIHSIERELLGTDHTEIGFLIASKWNLPPLVTEAIRHHHEEDVSKLSTAGPHALIVHVADALAHSFGFGADIAGLQRTVHPDAVAGLGLSNDFVDRLVMSALEEIQSTQQALREK